MPAETLTQARLKELLHYEPLTGVFTWRVDRRGGAFKGCVAGNINSHGYVRIGIDAKSYKAHRLAFLYMTGSFPADQVDHIDHKKDNNIFENIREASNVVNSKNATLPANNSSGICGVAWYKRDKKWRVQISIRGRVVHIGYFDDKKTAEQARKDADKKYSYHPNHGAQKP